MKEKNWDICIILMVIFTVLLFAYLDENSLYVPTATQKKIVQVVAGCPILIAATADIISERILLSIFKNKIKCEIPITALLIFYYLISAILLLFSDSYKILIDRIVVEGFTTIFK